MSRGEVNYMNCECSQYEHLELYRKAVSKRIKQTKTLKKQLEIIAEHSNGEYKLLKCPACGQLWQSSRAWNWGNDEYLFKVPNIQIDEWLSEPYIPPDEMLIYSAVMQDYMERNSFVETERECRAEGCVNRAVEFTVFCLEHHIESLQNAGALPKDPTGRWFAPYHRAGTNGDI
jgi:hypothetical protein